MINKEPIRRYVDHTSSVKDEGQSFTAFTENHLKNHGTQVKIGKRKMTLYGLPQ